MNKNELLQYLGPIDNLVGYQRSYKFVFLLNLLDTMNADGYAHTEQVAAKFRDFYMERARRGLPTDYNVTDAIKNIHESSMQRILSVIKENPYQSFATAGIVSTQSVNGREMFALEPELANQLTDNDKLEIKNILYKKLEYYYSSIERGLTMQSFLTLREVFAHIMDNYQPARATQPIAGNKMHSFFNQEARNTITNLQAFDSTIHSYKDQLLNVNRHL